MRASMILTSIFFILLFAPSRSFSQSKFEGKIVWEETDNGQITTVNYYVKGDKFRFDGSPGGQEGYVIFDNTNKKMLMIVSSAKMYMEFPLDSSWNYSSDEDSVTDFKKTGITKMINGYKCEQWTFKENGKTSEAWMTKQLGRIFFFGGSMDKKPKSKWEQEIFGSGYVPMLASEKDSNGNLTNSFQVKSIEKKNLEDSFFTVPAGYKKMEMPVGGEK